MNGPRGRPAPTPSVALVAFVALMLTVIVACRPAEATPTLTPPTTPTPTPSEPGPTETPAPGTVAIDASLLDILPEAVDGLALTENPEAEATSLRDPLLGQVASAIAAALAIDPQSSEFVYAVVVQLLPDAMDATIFRDWRDSFDEGACSLADGVSGHAETEIGGRTVYIGTCTGGLRTYHVWLEDRGVLISASAVGERRLGEHLVENLRP